MGDAGRNAARGFEYQFLCTLEHALTNLLNDSVDFAAVSVEEPTDELGADPEIVDFGIHDPDQCLLAAQVKSGVAGSEIRATQAVQILLRLLTRTAARYALITNRSLGYQMPELITLLSRHADQATDQRDFRQSLAMLVTGSEKTRRQVLAQDDTWWDRLRRTEIVTDDRTIDEVYTAVRERVRAARHHVEPSAVGWDAAGLLARYLIADILSAAAAKDAPLITRADLIKVLRRDQDTLKAMLVSRDWAVHVTTAPRGTDIGRHALLDQISRALPTPIRGDSAPVCMLTGLSGTGKTSLAAAWADDRADAYGVIMWIDASSVPQIEASFAMVASWFEGQGLITATGPDVRSAAFTALARSAQPWLMVFDNCNDNQQLRDWIPRRGHGHVLVTTTDQSLLGGPGIIGINVGAMSPSESIDMLIHRLSPDKPVTDQHRERLGRLARHLHHWPLALELAAAYLNNCLGGLRGTVEYENLVMRSLDDITSVPVGYPRTLVAAIILAWKRTLGRAGDAEQLASLSLRYAAFVASRKIPLHLLLACCVVEPSELAAAVDPKEGLWHYTTDTPPVGEIARALGRDSLATTDEPILSVREVDPRSPSSPGYTISMNDIVQSIIRQDMEREYHVPDVISVAAFHTRYWLTFFAEREDIGRATEMVGHAVSVADHALRLGIHDKGIALLLGNAAGVLGYNEQWPLAVSYLRAEMNCLDNISIPEPSIRLQAAAALGTALFYAAERPRDITADIIKTLETVLVEIPASCDRSEDITARHIRVALCTAVNLRNNGACDSRLPKIQDALTAYCAMLPVSDEIDAGSELIQLNEFIRRGRFAAAQETAERLLPKFGRASIERPQILRILTEAHANLQNWGAAQGIADQFMMAARNDTLSRNDATTFARNVAVASLYALYRQDEDAILLFRTALAVADLSAENRAMPKAGDKDVLAVYRALRACLDHDCAECDRWLRQVNIHDIVAVERGGLSPAIHRLLSRWIAIVSAMQEGDSKDSTYPRLDHTISRYTSGRGSRHQAIVPELSLDAVMEAITETSPERAPLMSLALTQALQAGGTPAREPREVAYELCLAMRVFGFEAEVVQTVLIVRRGDDDDLTNPEPTWFTPSDVANIYSINSPHYIVWSKTFGRCIDPIIPHLPAFYDLIARREMSPNPAIFPWNLSQHNATERIAVVPRNKLLLSYQLPEQLSNYETHLLLAEERRHEGEVAAMLLALRSNMHLSGAYVGRTAELQAIYPQLTETLITTS